ncbi:hypothetical protein G6011_07007 [Alternaria panax]|uniref:Uncharacterized protein n=1 Tax=Alternaria panax TaxID=48097 RepID=A0AAD4F9U3_9PLEO|nr:hypothetical protein G6011_07007 [Alternaria panax]
MEIEFELLVSNQHHKLVFPPHGAPYDKDTMQGRTEDGCGPGDNEDVSKYRVKLCISPAFYKCIQEPVWSDGYESALTAGNYKNTLLGSRNFFPEKPGKYRGWEGSFLVSPTTVFVDRCHE